MPRTLASQSQTTLLQEQQEQIIEGYNAVDKGVRDFDKDVRHNRDMCERRGFNLGHDVKKLENRVKELEEREKRIEEIEARLRMIEGGGDEGEEGKWWVVLEVKWNWRVLGSRAML